MAKLGTDPKLKVGLDKYSMPKKAAAKVKSLLKKKKSKKKAAR